MQQGLAVLVQQREIQVELAREVLVENRLADARALGDVVHGGRVIPLRNEYFLGGAEELVASGTARQASAPRACRLCLLDGCHAASQNCPHAVCAAPPSYFSVTPLCAVRAQNFTDRTRAITTQRVTNGVRRA
ncbi:hypothetical protein GCM10010317_076190 [Streptomyces mirabilis]|nr:hypothetical protein GCM10010317_076190 [Streptomyces mirabilis]